MSELDADALAKWESALSDEHWELATIRMHHGPDVRPQSCRGCAEGHPCSSTDLADAYVRLTADLAAERERVEKLRADLEYTHFLRRLDERLIERRDAKIDRLRAELESEREKGSALIDLVCEPIERLTSELEAERGRAERLTPLVEAATRLIRAKGPGGYMAAFNDLGDVVRVLTTATEGKSDG